MAVNERTDPNSATSSDLQALQPVLLRVGDFWRDMIQNLHPDSQHPGGLLGTEPALKYTTAYWPGASGRTQTANDLHGLAAEAVPGQTTAHISFR